MKSSECVLLILISIRLIRAAGCSEVFYSIPRPEIVVTTKGFRVSIPDEPGIEIFFFHGSINQALRFLEPGTITISTKTRNNGQWSLEHDLNLQVSDTIYFWLYVRKNGIGYTRPYDNYVIQEVLPHNVNTVHHSPAYNPIKAAEQTTIPSNNLNNHLLCQSEIQNMKQIITQMKERVSTLESTVQRLTTSNRTPNRQSFPETSIPTQKDYWVWN